MRLRVGLLGSDVIEGTFVAATADDLTIRTADGRIINLEAERIRTLALAHVRRGREWALVGVGIPAAVAGVAGLTALPLVGDYLRLHSQLAFKIVLFTAIGALVLLLGTTGLRNWLTRWETLLEDPER